MQTIIYVLQDETMIARGYRPRALLVEPACSRVWIEPYKVQLPSGFSVERALAGNLAIFCGDEHYSLTTIGGEPAIAKRGDIEKAVKLKIIAQGWNALQDEIDKEE